MSSSSSPEQPQAGVFATPNPPTILSHSTVHPPTMASAATNAPSTAPGTTSSQRTAGQIQRAISPPTPAPSPQPDSRPLRQAPSSLQTASVDAGVSGMQGILTPTHDDDDASHLLKLVSREFPHLDPKDRSALLAHVVDLCNARELAHLSSLISPRLKVDFLSALPIEVSLQIISNLDDPRTLARASCVSRFWRSLVNDEQTWKVMYRRYRFRQVPAMQPSKSFGMGLETPDQTMEPISVDSELASELEGSVESSQVLGSLYDAYRNRGLDPSTALSELKALHELFLSKRARETGVDERRRQLHALQSDNVFMDLMQDKNFVTRIAETTMSEDDKRFYGQLEQFVREKQAETPQLAGTSTLSETQDASAVGWLSTGPPSTRTIGGDDPRTPTAPSTSRYFGASSSLPLREVGRTLVSPTSRLGSMTSGLLTSLWDRTGASTATSALDARDHAPSQPPSAGDHGHSAEGHHNADEDEEMHIEEEPGQMDGPEGMSASIGSGPAGNMYSAGQPRRIGSRKASRRFAPFSRPGEDVVSPDSSSSLGLGRPSVLAGRGTITRSATTAEGGWGALGFEASDDTDSAFQVGSAPVPKRASSAGQSLPRLSSRRGKPFSYKTHFKLAYQTESNWLRGGRLLTQHVSSDDASGEGATVTSLSIDDEWIIVGMANAKIHAFDARTGLFVRTLTGHSAGVWCLSLISASGNRSSLAKGKSKARVDSDMDDEDESMKTVGAYPYDNDRPLYKPTPDLNLIHHDPRPAASVFSPELRHDDLGEDGRDDDYVRPSMPTPQQTSTWSQQRNSRSIHETLHSTRSLTPQPEPVSVSPLPPPRAAVEAAAAARASHSANRSTTGSFTSRGAGLGSNFGSPCGSVTGYGNEHAIVVSSGCDRDVRVWDLATGECKYVLSGHRSTVRCLRVFEGRPIAISGSRDGTMRVWNVETGQLQHLLPGHQHSVRCLDLAGNLVASASYDCTARIWNVDTGKCLHVLRGHYHQLYAIAFDGVHVATGSLDTTVRVWSAETGECLALLQGHTSLVGQLQLTDSTLITGGSDGKVIVYSLKTMKTLYQLLAHDNSVTCLQFDDRFIVTGGNDGKVKLWNFRTGEFVRELCESSDQVWKVSFRDDKCVVLCRRNDKTAMDVISFRPIEEGG